MIVAADIRASTISPSDRSGASKQAATGFGNMRREGVAAAACDSRSRLRWLSIALYIMLEALCELVPK